MIEAALIAAGAFIVGFFFGGRWGIRFGVKHAFEEFSKRKDFGDN